MAKIKSGFKGERAIVLPAFVVEQISNDVLGKELHITDIGYYPQAEFHYRERTKEEARQFVLIYCVKGNGWFELDGRHEEISEHQFFILPKEKAHKYGSTPKSPWTIYWVHFDGNKASFLPTVLISRPIYLPISIPVSKKGFFCSKKFSESSAGDIR